MKNTLFLLSPIALLITVALVTVPRSARLTDDPGPTSSVDSRPVGFISTHGAPRTKERPTGLRRSLIDPDDGYEWLLDQFLTRPHTRFIVHQPAGWRKGQQMGAAQYWPIDDAHLEMWERAIRDAMRLRPEITIGIYGSLSLQSTHSIDMDNRRWHRADFDNLRDRWAIWQQCVAPWIRAGAYEYWFDNASASAGRHDAILFHDWLAETHAVRTGTEAFPSDRQADGTWNLDLATMNRVPSLALLQFVRARDPQGKWDVNDLRYEAIIWVYARPRDPPVTVDELTSLLRRGFVLGAAEPLDAIVQQAHEIFSKGN